MDELLPAAGAAALREARTVFIVLGCSVNPDNSPSDWLRARLEAVRDAAAALTSSQRPFAVIVSGGAVRSAISEASCMQSWLTANASDSIPTEAIVLEEQAQDTLQNLEYALSLLHHVGRLLLSRTETEKRSATSAADDGGVSAKPSLEIVVVTNDFHMRRSIRMLQFASEYRLGVNLLAAAGRGGVVVREVAAPTPGLAGEALQLRMEREAALLESTATFHRQRMCDRN
jgi:hypothetical protein